MPQGHTLNITIPHSRVATGTGAHAGFSGRSGAFTMASLPTGLAPAAGLTGVPSFFVATSVPEPATLALAGLGGLASLVALRRKQA